MKSPRRKFDPQAFLAKVEAGKAILKYRKGGIIFAQGERLIHAGYEDIEPQSEGRQLKLEITHFLRLLVVPLIHDECLLSLVRFTIRRALCECSACTTSVRRRCNC